VIAEVDSSLILLAWVLLGGALFAMLVWLWQIDDRTRDAQRLLKEIREIAVRLDSRRDAEP
jgi:hypothetical protein